MYARHDGPWPARRQTPRERPGLGDRRAASSHDDDIRAAEGAPIFAPGTGRQRPCHMARGRALGAHDGDVDVTVDVEPLIRVIEHQYTRSLRAGFLRARQSVGIRHHDRVRYEPLMDGLLVAAIAAQQDARSDAPAREERGDPGGQGCLPRSADGEIADGDRRQRQRPFPQPAPGVGARPGAHDRAIEERDGQQDAARRARGRSAAPPQPLGNPLGAHPVPMTSCRLRDTASMPRRSPSLPASTSTGGAYITSIVVKGFGMHIRSQDPRYHAEATRAPTATLGTPACCAAAIAPGCTRSAGPRGPSGVIATTAPPSSARTIPNSPTSPPRCVDPRTERYPQRTPRSARYPPSRCRLISITTSSPRWRYSRGRMRLCQRTNTNGRRDSRNARTWSSPVTR